jgi:hypothetical protein
LQTSLGKKEDRIEGEGGREGGRESLYIYTYIYIYEKDPPKKEMEREGCLV